MKRVLFSIFIVAACGDDEPSPMSSEGTSTGAPADSASDASMNTSSEDPPRADLGVQPPEVCEASCATEEACQGVPAADCLLRCTADLNEAHTTSSDCGEAREAVEACMAALSCEQRAQHDTSGDSPCRTLQQDAALVCAPDDASTTCADFCATSVECDLGDEPTCLAGCVELRSAATVSGAACLDAQDAQLTCAAQLDCASLETWVTTGELPGCPALDLACTGDSE